MTAPFPKKAEASSIEEAVRKDSAVHVSLSSDSLVKQPETSRFRLRWRVADLRRSRRSLHIRQGQSSWPDDSPRKQ